MTASVSIIFCKFIQQDSTHLGRWVPTTRNNFELTLTLCGYQKENLQVYPERSMAHITRDTNTSMAHITGQASLSPGSGEQVQAMYNSNTVQKNCPLGCYLCPGLCRHPVCCCFSCVEAITKQKHAEQRCRGEPLNHNHNRNCLHSAHHTHNHLPHKPPSLDIL